MTIYYRHTATDNIYQIIIGFIYIYIYIFFFYRLLRWLSGKKNLPANAGDAGLIPGSEKSLGEGKGNPSQYFCLRNPMDRGAWQATVYGIAKSWTFLSNWAHTKAYIHMHIYIYILHITHNLPSYHFIYFFLILFIYLFIYFPSYHFKCSVQPVSTFTLCNESPKLFSSLKAETRYPLNNSPLPSHPKPWQLPFYFLSLWIWPF